MVDVPGTSAAKPNPSVVLRNKTCIYCGRTFDESLRRTREHVIGRKFVPEGKIQAADWNLIVRACFDCNHAKSELEGEISAISLQPEIGIRHQDAALHELALRKASGAKSYATGRMVRDSVETPSYKVSLGGGSSMTIGFVGPPRLRSEAVEELARAHVQAFFYFVTYDQVLRTGRLLPGGIVWSTWTRKPDWGNAKMRWFAKTTALWPTAFFGEAAKGFFKLALRRMSPDSQLGAFAVEWNQSVRIIGFFGSSKELASITSGCPEEVWHQVSATERIREEIPLSAENDILFPPASPESV